MNVLRAFPEKPPMKRRRIYMVLSIILLDSLLIIALILFFPLLTESPNRSLTSSNWAGYIVASDLNNPQPRVTSINASWVVPAVNGPGAGSNSATWIGVGGQFDDTLIQTGTEQHYLHGGQYSAWYELLSSNSVTINSLTVSPGDSITASISLLDLAANTWSIEIHDVSSNQSFKNSFTYISSMLSAEWIVEAPTVNNHARTLADFGAITFIGCTATIGDNIGTISSYSHIKVTMYNRLNTQLVSVSPLDSQGTSFTVNYDHS
jgi:hypothetical protein